jgi:hypothetical protein
MVMQMESCATHRHQRMKYLLRSIGVSIFLCIAQGVQADNVENQSAQLQLKPNRCVALHQGQMCYQTVQLSWSANQSGNYCLYRQYADVPIFCWQGAAAGQHQYEFTSDTSVQLQLVDEQTQTPVATATVEVAWVYKANTRRKTHWRLF